MHIGGFQRFSLIDFPGRVSGIIFVAGCNFRCPYCHNPELVNPALFPPPIEKEEIVSFFKNRIGKLDGVVITGGEPTLASDLISFIRKFKEMHYLVKLDTNGSHPDILDILLSEGLIDYVAMDIKAPFEKYEEITKVKIDTEKIQKSINLIMSRNVEYEFRTTYFTPLLSEEDIVKISILIKGAKRYAIQRFRSGKLLMPEYSKKSVSLSEKELLSLKEEILKNVKTVIIR